MPDSMPAVVPTPQNLFFWTGAREGRLLVQRCARCARYQHPPVPLCAGCHSRELEPVPVSGHGHVYSFTVVRRVFHPAFTSAVPYVLALIELQEQAGLRLVSQVVACAAEAVSVGMPVTVTFQPSGEWALPLFRPIERLS